MSKKILIVDDSRTARMHLKRPLEQAGYEVLEADSGSTGYETVMGSQDSIDLVISDYNMPDMNGVQMVQKIRELSDHVNTNCLVVFLTSDSSPVVKNQCSQVQAKAILMKPIQPPALVKVAKKLFEMQEEEEEDDD